MRLTLAAILLLTACADLPGEENSIAYEGPNAVTVALGEEPEPDDNAQPSALAAYAGFYGVSAADCDPDNRYMSETIEMTDVGFAYRGEFWTLAEIIDEDAFRFSASDHAREVLRFDDDRLVRWPDDRRMRTVYTRCV